MAGSSFGVRNRSEQFRHSRRAVTANLRRTSLCLTDSHAGHVFLSSRSDCLIAQSKYSARLAIFATSLSSWLCIARGICLHFGSLRPLLAIAVLRGRRPASNLRPWGAWIQLIWRIPSGRSSHHCQHGDGERLCGHRRHADRFNLQRESDAINSGLHKSK